MVLPNQPDWQGGLQWRDQEPAVFAQGFSTVTFDAYGCGQSEKPRVYEAYHPEELYKDAEAVLESLVQVQNPWKP